MVISTIFIGVATAGLMVALAKYEPPQHQMVYKQETVYETPIVIVQEEVKPDIFNETGFDYLYGYRGKAYCRYEITADNYDNLDDRISKLTAGLQVEGKDTQIFLLNPQNTEQVLKLYENSELIWSL